MTDTGSRPRLGRILIAVAAWSSILVPIGVDGWIAADAHMRNPLWLPHAKLHTAMSFFGAIGLGMGALLVLRVSRSDDWRAMAVAAFLATAFWFGLIGAGFWPGTSYDFANDPAVYLAPPTVGGIAIYPNVVAASLSIILGWAGFALTRLSARDASRDVGGPAIVADRGRK